VPRESLFELTRLETVMASFDGREVAVLGDAMLDRYVWGNVTRISPEAPVPVVEVEEESVRLGGAANVAQNIAALGASPYLVAVRGADAGGRQLADELAARGISPAALVEDAGRATTLKTRLVARHQQVARIDRESREEIRGDLERRVGDRLIERLDRLAALVISDYGKGVVTAALLERVLPAAERAGVPICVDPKETHFASYRRVSVLTPNTSEASFAFGTRIRDAATLEVVGWGLLKKLESRSLLITRGEHGMSLFEEGGGRLDLPAVAREVFDVTGAGDTVVSTFAVALAAGASFREAMLLSDYAAGLAVAELGTAAPSRDALSAAVRDGAAHGGPGWGEGRPWGV